MTRRNPDMLGKVRSALQRNGVKLSNRADMDKCMVELEKVLGRPLSNSPSQRAKEINDFVGRGLSWDLPKRPWKPLVGYEAALRRVQELAESTR